MCLCYLLPYLFHSQKCQGPWWHFESTVGEWQKQIHLFFPHWQHINKYRSVQIHHCLSSQDSTAVPGVYVYSNSPEGNSRDNIACVYHFRMCSFTLELDASPQIFSSPDNIMCYFVPNCWSENVPTVVAFFFKKSCLTHLLYFRPGKMDADV